MWAIWCYRPISNTIGIDYIIDPLGFLINLGPVPNVNQKKALVLSIKAIADSSALFRLCVCYTLLVETILIIDTQEQSWNSPFDFFIFIFYCILRGIFRVFAGGEQQTRLKQGTISYFWEWQCLIFQLYRWISKSLQLIDLKYLYDLFILLFDL